jgi:hypothetical protein
VLAASIIRAMRLKTAIFTAAKMFPKLVLRQRERAKRVPKMFPKRERMILCSKANKACALFSVI